MGVHIPKGKGKFGGGVSGPLVVMAFLSSFITEKHIRVMHEKFIIFLLGQYINGDAVYWSLLRCSLLQDRSWHL